ncbi:hypothetical protein SLS55_007856 [Diplodia seriata]|uniref:Uncharacterized protein n=1 Tax=Diplodia seriata TaxID=420778 RepID=A0ABR3CBA2_9PEZI
MPNRNPPPTPTTTILTPPVPAASDDLPGLTWAAVAHRPLHFDGDVKRWDSAQRDTWPIYARDSYRSDRGPKRWREDVVLTAQHVGVLQIVRNNFSNASERKIWAGMCARKWPLNFKANGKPFKVQPVMPEGWAERWKAMKADQKAAEEREKKGKTKGEEVKKKTKMGLAKERREVFLQDMEKRMKEDGKTNVVKLTLAQKAGPRSESGGIEPAVKSDGNALQAQAAVRVPATEPGSEKDIKIVAVTRPEDGHVGDEKASGIGGLSDLAMRIRDVVGQVTEVDTKLAAVGMSGAAEQPAEVQKSAKANDTLKRKREDWRIDDVAHKRLFSEVQGKIAHLRTSYNDAKKSRLDPKKMADLESKASDNARRIKELENEVKERDTRIEKIEHHKSCIAGSLRQLRIDHEDVREKCHLMTTVCKDRNLTIQLSEVEAKKAREQIEVLLSSADETAAILTEKKEKIQRFEADAEKYTIDMEFLKNKTKIMDSEIRNYLSLLQESSLRLNKVDSEIQQYSAESKELADKLNAAEKREERLEQTLYMTTKALLEVTQDEQVAAASTRSDRDSSKNENDTASDNVGLRHLLQQIVPQNVREGVINARK